MDTYDKRLQELGYPTDYRGYRKYCKDRKDALHEQFYDPLRPCFCCLSVPTRKRHHELHHFDYSTLGREAPTDLVQVCHRCHREIHLLVRHLNVPLREAHLVYRAARVANGHWHVRYDFMVPREVFHRARRYAAQHGLAGPPSDDAPKAAVNAIRRIQDDL